MGSRYFSKNDKMGSKRNKQYQSRFYRNIALSKKELTEQDIKATYVRIDNTDISPTSPLIVPITVNLKSGTNSFNQFIGNRITPVSLKIRFVAKVGSNSNDSIRVVVVQALVLAGLGVHDVFVTPTPTDNVDPKAPINRYSGSLFNVLDDQYFRLDTTYETVKNGVCFSPKNDMIPITFQTGGSAIVNGAIYMFVITNSLAETLPTFALVSDLKYDDK